MTDRKNECSFSIEMPSSVSLNHVSLSTESSDGVLIKGKLGELESIELHECIMLEVKGEEGVLRLDVNYDELCDAVKKAGGSKNV